MTDLTAKIAELEAGCEGVPPGPWHVKDYGPKRMLEIYSSDMDAGDDGRPLDRGERICDMADTENESETAAHIARCDPQTILELIAAWRAEKARADEAANLLPLEMPGCKIELKECELGHGRLTATNWIDHGCPWCRIAALEADNKRLREALDVEREECAKIADDEDQEIASSGQHDNWVARQDALKEVAAKIRARAALSARQTDSLRAGATLRAPLAAPSERANATRGEIIEECAMVAERTEGIEPPNLSYGMFVANLARKAIAAKIRALASSPAVERAHATRGEAERDELESVRYYATEMIDRSEEDTWIRNRAALILKHVTAAIRALASSAAPGDGRGAIEKQEGISK
jgi:hypothetical protein